MVRTLVDDIMDYETGEMSEAQLKKFFQKLVDTGQAWKLQGSYGRTASAMLNAGFIKFPKKKTYDYYGNPIPMRKKVQTKLKGGKK